MPTLADIFATAFSSIGKVELAVEAAHVADHDVWIADARGLDDMLLKHRKPREQGAEDTSWDMLFATLVGKGIITIFAKLRVFGRAGRVNGTTLLRSYCSQVVLCSCCRGKGRRGPHDRGRAHIRGCNVGYVLHTSVTISVTTCYIIPRGGSGPLPDMQHHP